MTLAIAGARSRIALEFVNLCWIGPDEVIGASISDLPLDATRYLICTGYLAGRSLSELGKMESVRTWQLNFLHVAAKCDEILAVNPEARICIIGSESGIRGSYDAAYAGAKAAMHLYVETKKLEHPKQMLVALAPHIIADAGMTLRRGDYEDAMERGKETRLGRWLTSREVAEVAADALYRWPSCMSGQVIRMRAD